jgi:hypothetical protein
LVVVAGCGGPQPPAAAETSAEEETAAPASQRMREHFVDVGFARDAVVAGDIEGVRAPLRRIAAAEYGSDLPPDWREWVREMQQWAGHYADVPDLPAAAFAVAELTETCADCHRTTLGGPTIEESTEPAHSEDLHGRMVAHAWGIEQLWLGLTAPSHEAWVRGAAAIIGDPMTPEGAPIDDALATELEEVRALGRRAQDAGQPARKANVYAQLIAQCADCHTRLAQRALGDEAPR